MSVSFRAPALAVAPLALAGIALAAQAPAIQEPDEPGDPAPDVLEVGDPPGPFAAEEDLTGLQVPAEPQPEESWFIRTLAPIDFGGGIFLWHYEPLLDGVDPNTQIYWAYLTLDIDLSGDVDFHLQPMFRDEKLRPFFTSNVWLQEAYLSWKPEKGRYGQLKAGKVYTRFGRFWDGSFYGNVPYFDGLKLDPDLGLSYEHAVEAGDDVRIETVLQFLTRDGSTNGSLQGRDTLSFDGAVQRNQVVARVAPTVTLGDGKSLTVGASATTFEADFEEPAPSDEVTRWGVDAELALDRFSIFGEYAHQSGLHALGYPVAGIDETDIWWIMSGVSYRPLEWLKLGYNFSYGDYGDSDTTEVFHMPRVEFQISEATSFWIEYVDWNQDRPGGDSSLDESVNLVLYAYF